MAIFSFEMSNYSAYFTKAWKGLFTKRNETELTFCQKAISPVFNERQI